MRIDRIFENATFYTQSAGGRPTASRVGVLNGRVVGVDGDLDGVSARHVVDLGGAFVIPGLYDAHFHLTHIGRRARMVDVTRDAAPSLEDLYDRVGQAALTASPGEWIFAGAYDQHVLGRHPTAVGLDAVSPHNPVWIEHCSGHMGVVNTRVFDMLGFTQGYGVPDVEHGVVAREEDGRAAGLLQSEAQAYVAQAVGRPDLAMRAADIRTGAEVAARMGLTSITEPGIGGERTVIGGGSTDFGAYQAVLEAGQLPVRCTVMPALESLGYIDGLPLLGLPHGIRSGFGTDRLRLGATKGYADGSLIGQTAALEEPYADDPCNHGAITLDPVDLTRRITHAHAAGWQIAVHAIGDRGIDLVLDAFAAAQDAMPRVDARHRIEHLTVASAGQVRRAAALGIVPVPQGSFLYEFGDGYVDSLGETRLTNCLRYKSLLLAGIEVPGSSDAPVTSGDPFVSLQAMVSRRTRSGRKIAAGEALSVAEAIRAYTVGSAYADHREHELGRLERGFLADMTVLNRNPFAKPDSFEGVSATGTVVGGAFVYDGR